jgi:hypothetical protein
VDRGLSAVNISPPSRRAEALAKADAPLRLSVKFRIPHSALECATIAQVETGKRDNVFAAVTAVLSKPRVFPGHLNVTGNQKVNFTVSMKLADVRALTEKM